MKRNRTVLAIIALVIAILLSFFFWIRFGVNTFSLSIDQGRNGHQLIYLHEGEAADGTRYFDFQILSDAQFCHELYYGYRNDEYDEPYRRSAAKFCNEDVPMTILSDGTFYFPHLTYGLGCRFWSCTGQLRLRVQNHVWKKFECNQGVCITSCEKMLNLVACP